MKRPKLVTVAIGLFGLSLAFRVYSELSFLGFLADSTAFQIGRALVPIGFYAIQGWVLWKVAHGRNWARVTLLIFVLLNTGITALLLGNPFGAFLVSYATAALQIIVEVIAVVFLLLSAGFFTRPKDVL